MLFDFSSGQKNYAKLKINSSFNSDNENISGFPFDFRRVLLLKTLQSQAGQMF